MRMLSFSFLKYCKLNPLRYNLSRHLSSDTIPAAADTEKDLRKFLSFNSLITFLIIVLNSINYNIYQHHVTMKVGHFREDDTIY